MSHEHDSDHLIAIVGMAGRFPDAPTVDAFWRNLVDGVESVHRFDDATLAAAGVPESLRRHPGYVPAKATLDDVDRFDAGLFGFNPRDAAVMDPQLRLLMTCAWETLESAGCDPARYPGPIGLFAGMSMSTYMLLHLWAHQELVQSLGPLQLRILNDKDFLATWISYRLDLRGPSLAVQTACSTSLVAVHLACQSLLAHECDAAMAGGVTVSLPQQGGYVYQEGSIYSPDGHCRPFDQNAQGTVSGNGVGLVMLKRLTDAIDDGDVIRAVIRGSAINNDGAHKVGYMAPSVDSQAEVIATAQAVAEVEADSIGYIEAHGTGTAMGDPIEVEALRRVFTEVTERKRFCALGSLKSNVGHLDQAAGVAGLMKAALVVERGVIPPTVHFTAPHPELALDDSPFFVVADRAKPWAGDGPRRAGVSSFGVGGTNAHVVVEEPPERPAASRPRRRHELLVLSARSADALEKVATRLADHLDGTDDKLADIAHTLQTGRRELAERRAVVARDRAHAVQALRAPGSSARAADGHRGVAFLFPGQGSQYPDMARGLYDTEPVVRDVIDRASRRLAGTLGEDLRGLLFPASDKRDAAAVILKETRYTQPALFTIEYALATLIQSWGIEPEAMLGHSIGEFVAACVGGTMSFEVALDLVTARGRLMDDMPTGAMISVGLDADAVEAALTDDLTVAAINEPGSVVVAGPETAVTAFATRLGERGIQHKRLHTSHAFHSAMMEPAMRAFERTVAEVRLEAPTIRWVSNVTGTWITDEEAVDPGYWARHLRQTVRFAEGVTTLAKSGSPVLLELGPGHTLSTLARRQLASREDVETVPIVPTLRRPRDEAADEATVLEAVGQLWMAGVEIDWAKIRGDERRHKVVLPTYPFEAGRYWVEPPATDTTPSVAERSESLTSESLAAESGTSESYMVLEAPQQRDGATPVNNEVDIQRDVAAVFSEVLGVAEPRPTDDFFALGGHSLLATQAVARLRDRFVTELPIDALFDAPTVRACAGVVRASQRADTGPIIPLEPVPRQRDANGEARFPASFAQERMWFLHQLDPHSSAYHLPLVTRIDGELDVDALRHALADLVARHESLRTVFANGDDERPIQVIRPAMNVALPVIEVQDEIDLAAHLHHEAERPFDLVYGPLLRASLVRRSDTEHILLLTLHHIVTDGWSNAVLLRDLADGYDHRRGGDAPAPRRLHYADFAVWQRRHLADERLERQLEYWRRQLDDAPVLAVPTDHARPAAPSGRGGRVAITLEGPRVAALEARARDAEATLFQILLATWAVVLGRWSAQDDVVIGTPIANRHRSETEDLVGFFVNTLALRCDLSGSPDFASVLGRIRQTTLEAYRHQDLPFEQLIDALALERTRSTPPLVQVMMTFQSVPTTELEVRGLRFEPMKVDDETARFDLVLDLVPIDGEVRGRLEYSLDLFTESTARRLVTAFERVLDAVVEEPHTPIARLPLLADEARQRLLSEWGDGGPASLAGPFLEAFAHQVTAAPDAPAVVGPDRSLTYGELDRLSDALARRLRAEHGVGSGTLVAVLLERSVPQVTTYVAIWKAGGAYLPLDPAQPPARLARMLGNAGVRVVVTREGLSEHLDSGIDTSGIATSGIANLVVSIDSLLEDGDHDGSPFETVTPDPAELAYVIYTSGSTGEPKGIEVSHGSLANMIGWYFDVFDPGPGDRSALLVGPSFDPSVKEIWPALATGAAIHVAPPNALADPDALIDWTVREGITLTIFPTPVAELAIRRPWPEQPALRVLMTGGDKLLKPPSVPLPFDFVNHYGPTENTVVATMTAVKPVLGAAWAGSEAPTIGTPIQGVTVRVLGGDLEPTPVGVAGELCLGGASLAVGYRTRPGLTAERFVPDPFATVAGARLYRTGDRVRWRHDGELEFLERVDHQVKLRGFRIELAEIEAAMSAFEGIDAAAVAVLDDPRGIKRLVAWVASSAELAVDTVAARLGERVPDYMVPTVITRLESLPMTPNGKIDRAALPAPTWPTAGSGRPPEGEIETALARIWTTLLGSDEIRADDNFFALGGDSILGVQVVSRARQEGIGLEPRHLFEHQTIATLARVATRIDPEAAEPAVPASDSETRDGNAIETLVDEDLSATDLDNILAQLEV
ncbi:MAG: amino acid adenylation domain-containing protein [Acidobacteriota bacterium]